MTDVHSIRALLKKTAALPHDRPMGMPGVFYTSDAFFDYEKTTILNDGWHCLGRVDEVANPGDYFALRLLDEPLIVVRGDDGLIRVLANSCRHRGMPLAAGSGNSKRFVCSYHAWAYGRDGTLLRAARMKNQGFETKSCRLPEFPCQIWRGFVYTSLSESPPSFDVETEGLDDLVGNYEPENYNLVHVAEENWHTNWKCLVENFMEGYHLSVVHPQTLHGYTPTGLAKKGPAGPGYTSYVANYPQDIPFRGGGSPTLTERQRHCSTLFATFPTQVTSLASSLLVSLMIRPLSAELITVKWTMSVYKDSLDAETVKQRIALWEEVNREDREKLEWMQGALRSKFASAGPLAGEDYEGTIIDFQHWLARQSARA